MLLFSIYLLLYTGTTSDDKDRNLVSPLHSFNMSSWFPGYHVVWSWQFICQPKQLLSGEVAHPAGILKPAIVLVMARVVREGVGLGIN